MSDREQQIAALREAMSMSALPETVLDVLQEQGYDIVPSGNPSVLERLRESVKQKHDKLVATEELVERLLKKQAEESEYDMCTCGHTRDDHVSYCPVIKQPASGHERECPCSAFTKALNVGSGYPFNPATGEDWPECHQQANPSQ